MVRTFWRFAVIAAVLACSHPAFAQEQKLIMRDPPTGGEVYLSEVGDFIELRSIAPSTVLVAYLIDVNRNGVVDSNVDLRFAFNGCAQVQYTATSTSGCSGFKTAGSYTEEVIGSQKVTKWRIPRRELSRDGVGFGITLEFYDSATKLTRPGRTSWIFSGGAPAIRPAAAAAKPAAASQGRLLARNAQTATQIAVAEEGESLIFQSQGPANITVSYRFDVNDNGAADEYVDLDYYLTPDDKPCVAYRIGAPPDVACGRFDSGARYGEKMVGAQRVTTWRIPKKEVSLNGATFRYTVVFRDGTTGASSLEKGTYRLGAGPAARPVVDPRKSMPIPYARWGMKQSELIAASNGAAQKSSFSEIRLTADQVLNGLPFQVTFLWTTSDPPGLNRIILTAKTQPDCETIIPAMRRLLADDRIVRDRPTTLADGTTLTFEIWGDSRQNCTPRFSAPGS